MEFIVTHIKVIANSLGLLLGVVGAFLVWKFGLPASIDRAGATHIISEQQDEAEIKLAKKYDFRSGVGFWLIIFGFLFQLASNFL